MATFNESAGGPIPLSTAKKWTANYRVTSKPDDTEAHYFGGDIIHRLLNQDKSVGIRMYYALDDQGKKQLLLVGVDKDGNNLLPVDDAAGRSEGDDPIIVDYSLPCPTYCGNKPL